MNQEAHYRSRFARADVIVGALALFLAFGLLILALNKVNEYPRRVGYGEGKSINNLRQMSLGIHSIADCFEGRLQPAAGEFPRNGPNSSLFFHMLPFIERIDVHNKYVKDPTKIPDTEYIKAYSAMLDPSNPYGNTNLVSYASNAAVFGLTDGGSIRFPADFKNKGTSNTVLFMERFAVVGATGTRHTWNGVGDQENYLYPPAEAIKPENIAAPQFGLSPSEARNDAPHAFQPQRFHVGMADGSYRTLTSDVARTFIYADGQRATIWAWACSLDGPLGKVEAPTDW